MTSSEDESYADDFVDELTTSMAAPAASSTARGGTGSEKRSSKSGSDDEHYTSDSFEDDVEASAEASRAASAAVHGRESVGSSDRSHSGSSHNDRPLAKTPAKSGSSKASSKESHRSHRSSRGSSRRSSHGGVASGDDASASSPACLWRQPERKSDRLPHPKLGPDAIQHALPTASTEMSAPSSSSREVLVPAAKEIVGHATRTTQMPSASAQWRAPVTLDPVAENLATLDFPLLGLAVSSNSGVIESSARFLPPSEAAPRTHDAVARHLKPHAWDIASLGQEPHLSRTAWPPSSSSTSCVGGYPIDARVARYEHGQLALGAETRLVDRIAERFILDRKSQHQERRERVAYQEMLQQVAWTALDAPAAQEAATLLSNRSLEPVSSSEALRAFRRCLHAILSDERVLDIVEHQMALHFSNRLARTAVVSSN